MNLRITGVVAVGVLLVLAGCKNQTPDAKTRNTPSVVQAAAPTVPLNPAPQPADQTPATPAPAAEASRQADSPETPAQHAFKSLLSLKPNSVIHRCGPPLHDQKGRVASEGEFHNTRLMVYEGPQGLVGVNFASLGSPDHMMFVGAREPNGPMQSVMDQDGRDNIMTMLPCLADE